MLRSNILKTRLKAGETVFGITLASAHATIAEMIGLAGFDYVLIDAEHGIGGHSGPSALFAGHSRNGSACDSAC